MSWSSWLSHTYPSTPFYPTCTTDCNTGLQINDFDLPSVFESRSQFSNDLEVFLDSEDGEVTIKEFCQGIMRLGLQSAPCAFPKHAL